MKSSGFSFTFCVGWIVTILAVTLNTAVLSVASKGPVIVAAANVLIVTSFALLILVPMILLSKLRNTRRTADYLREIVDHQVDAAASKPSTVIQ